MRSFKTPPPPLLYSSHCGHHSGSQISHITPSSGPLHKLLCLGRSSPVVHTTFKFLLILHVSPSCTVLLTCQERPLWATSPRTCPMCSLPSCLHFYISKEFCALLSVLSPRNIPNGKSPVKTYDLCKLLSSFQIIFSYLLKAHVLNNVHSNSYHWGKCLNFKIQK